jgi:hypothetical protein
MDDTPKDLEDEITKLFSEKRGNTPVEMREVEYELLAKHHGHLRKEQLLAIDLSEYDRLRTYPSEGTDWQLMRDRVLFLQTAVRAGISWYEVAGRTIPHFGKTLKPPFEAVTQPLEPSAYQPPIYDHSRHTPAEWALEADAGWRQHRDKLLEVIQAEFEQLVASGELKVFNRPRVTRESSPKAAILDERTAYKMAVQKFFVGAKWAGLADEYPPHGGYRGRPTDKVRQKRRRANQIRMRIRAILKHVGLPDGDMRK